MSRIRLVLASASPARLSTLRAAGLRPEVVVSGVDESGLSHLPPAELARSLAILKAEAVSTRLSLGDAAVTVVVGCDSVLELDGVAYGKPGTVEQATERWRQMRGRTGVLHTGHHVILRRSPDPRDPATDPDPDAAPGSDTALAFDAATVSDVSPDKDRATDQDLAPGEDAVSNPDPVQVHVQVPTLLQGSAEVASRTAGAATTVHFADLSDAEIDAYVATGEPLVVAGGFTVDGLGGPFVTRVEGDYHNVVGISLPLLRTMLIELGVSWVDLWTAR